MNIKEEITESFRKGGTSTKLIYVNLAVYLLWLLLSLAGTLFVFNAGAALDYVMLPSEPSLLLHRAWTLLTYMFVHKSFVHILFNVLNLYWFSRLFLSCFNGKQLLGLYVIGGVAGGLAYVAAFNLFPYFAQLGDNVPLLGASASVLAVMAGIAAYNPNMQIRLALIGQVRLKWLAAVVFVLSVLISAESNPGGSFAHAGGILAGYCFGKMMLRGKDLTAWLNRTIDFFVDLRLRKPRMRVVKNPRRMTDEEWNVSRKQDEETLNRILEKIKKSGYESLSASEKRTLFEVK